MTLSIADRLFETTTTTGTGPFTLSGAVQGFQGFASLGTGKKATYYIDDADSSGVVQKWMDVIGTVTVSGGITTLSVDTVLASSAGGTTPASFGSGTKNVRGGIGSKILVITDENLNFVREYGADTGAANAHAVALPYTPLAYSDGMEIVYRVATLNTTAGVTVNVNGLGAKALKINGADPGAGTFPVGTLIVAIYKASNNTFEIINIRPKVDLTSDVTGVLPAANGGAGLLASSFSARVLSGLQINNNTSDTVNDIDVAAGYAADGVGNFRQLTSGVTRQLDALFGTGNGGLFSGTKASNTTYHVWLIRNTSSGNIDVGFSSNFNTTTKLPTDTPSGWTVVCRIASLYTLGSSDFVQFVQNGDDFDLKTNISNYNGAGSSTAANQVVSVPLGIKMLAKLLLQSQNATGVSTYRRVYDPALSDTAASGSNSNFGGAANASVITGSATSVVVRTNTSAQVRHISENGVGAMNITTSGWTDRRGKED